MFIVRFPIWKRLPSPPCVSCETISPLIRSCGERLKIWVCWSENGCTSPNEITFSSDGHLRKISWFGERTSLSRIEHLRSVEVFGRGGFNSWQSLRVVIVQAGCGMRKKDWLKHIKTFLVYEPESMKKRYRFVHHGIGWEEESQRRRGKRKKLIDSQKRYGTRTFSCTELAVLPSLIEYIEKMSWLPKWLQLEMINESTYQANKLHKFTK
jgi:hypothetical protein